MFAMLQSDKETRIYELTYLEGDKSFERGLISFLNIDSKAKEADAMLVPFEYTGRATLVIFHALEGSNGWVAPTTTYFDVHGLAATRLLSDVEKMVKSIGGENARKLLELDTPFDWFAELVHLYFWQPRARLPDHQN